MTRINLPGLSPLAPLTFTVGFLETSLQTFAGGLLQWTREHQQDVESSAVEGLPLEVLRSLEPLTMLRRRELLLATKSAWTVYFDNGTKGADPFGPISCLAERLGCRGLIVTNMPHTIRTQGGRETGMSGALQFELFAPEEREFLNHERSISVAYDGGKWRFDATGSVQPFEDLERYQAQEIRDRFTAVNTGRIVQRLSGTVGRLESAALITLTR